ncbi:MAG TPA: acyl carrier protein [Thermotogota bacterium]|jgi:acyl carrier protein|nr:acyl carrier protein [Thermotogota bacterium]NLH19872.1 acyl carrier protein [Thermotogaceae bacterium]OQC31892.1 MAG: Acyl carrier protein [Thermotogota bacterium ADurb.Bin062]HNW47167.1 acyl carrier protein [Thermotogota bacterium]HNY82281.1 acyl carrier protein [Thermotogota bacterium]
MRDLEIYEIVKGIIVKRMGVSASTVLPQSSLTEDIGADSLELVDLMMDLEEILGIRIENSELSDVETVRDVVNLIESKRRVSV